VVDKIEESNHMEMFRISTGKDFSIEVSVRESDKYTEAAYVKIARLHELADVSGTIEMFMTPAQLDLLGRFLIRQAEELSTAQKIRKNEEV